MGQVNPQVQVQVNQQVTGQGSRLIRIPDLYTLEYQSLAFYSRYCGFESDYLEPGYLVLRFRASEIEFSTSDNVDTIKGRALIRHDYFEIYYSRREKKVMMYFRLTDLESHVSYMQEFIITNVKVSISLQNGKLIMAIYPRDKSVEIYTMNFRVK